MIVVCGEALLDVFGQGDTPTGLQLDARIGGSPLNVAIGLARMGQPSTYFAGISTDFMGERLHTALRAEDVDLSCIKRTSAPTTLGVVGLDSRGVASYAFYGHGGADRQLLPDDLALVPSAQAFHFGSFAMVVEPVGSTQRALVEREHGRAVIAYDPNVRLNVEPDLDVWRATLDWMAPRTHLLKISDEDAQALYPDVPVQPLAERWLAAGVGLVVVTRGAHGAQAWTRGGATLEQPGVPTALVDTVGAGDTFQAALLTALAERGLLNRRALVDGLEAATLAEVMDFAARAAAITCSRRGADLPRRAELG